MKTIFTGTVDITVDEKDGEYIARATVFPKQGGSSVIISDPSNREYAAISDLFAKLKKLAIDAAH